MNLHYLRKSAGKSLERVAREVGVSINTVRNWEEYTSSPQVKYLPSLAKSYGVDVLKVLEACINGRV